MKNTRISSSPGISTTKELPRVALASPLIGNLLQTPYPPPGESVHESSLKFVSQEHYREAEDATQYMVQCPMMPFPYYRLLVI
uniref:Uncharacterized protein n=1 Tax=Sphaerodactylus townsendi TaxID=933632 RepID=A0ACB8FBR9_9SAUR